MPCIRVRLPSVRYLSLCRYPYRRQLSRRLAQAVQLGVRGLMPFSGDGAEQHAVGGWGRAFASSVGVAEAEIESGSSFNPDATSRRGHP
jgi:hypothetical protein